MRKLAKRLLLSIFGLCAVGGLLALPAEPVLAASDEMEITIEASIPLSLDVSDRSNPVFRGAGNIYMTTEDASSHQFVAVSMPEELAMIAPDGECTAPEGSLATYSGSMNARKGYLNYQAKNGLNGMTVNDISTGNIEVVIPVTAELLAHGQGNYSVSIPITFKAREAYGSYSSNLDFTPWDELISNGTLKVSSNKITAITQQDEILEIDPSIKGINYDAFKNVPYKEVYVPASVNNASTAFEYSQVETIYFGEGMIEIPASIARNATNLKKVVLPASATTVGNRAFEGCEKLFDINLSQLTTLKYSCFKNCKGITEYTLSPGTTVTATYSISDSPFYGSGLTKVDVLEGNTTVPNYMFCDCENLEEVNLPTTLTTMGQSCFANVPSLKEITIKSEITITGSSTALSPFKNTGLEKVTFVDGITKVPQKLFREGCTNVTEINLPSSITKIETDAFYGCSSLSNLNLPGSVEVIEYNAFYGATSLNELNINSSWSKPGSNMISPFNGSAIKDVYVQGGITELNRMELAGSSDGITLHLPASVTSIDSHAFEEGETYSVIYDGTEAEYALITKGVTFTPTEVKCIDTMLNASLISTEGGDIESLITEFIDESNEENTENIADDTEVIIEQEDLDSVEVNEDTQEEITNEEEDDNTDIINEEIKADNSLLTEVNDNG